MLFSAVQAEEQAKVVAQVAVGCATLRLVSVSVEPLERHCAAAAGAVRF